MVPATIFGILDKPLVMTAMLFASFVSVVFINLDKFESFRAGEIEAQMRKVEEVIEEAHATIDQLKEMTTPLLDYSLANIVSDNRMTGVAAYDKKLFYEKALENISNFNIKQEHTSRLLDAVKRQVALTYLLELENQSEIVSGGWSENEPVREFFNKFDLEGLSSGKTLFPPPSAFNVFYDANPKHDGEEIRKRIEEYGQFLNTHF